MLALLVSILLMQGTTDTGQAQTAAQQAREGSFERARRLEKGGDLVGAMVEYEKVLERDPMHADALGALASLYVVKGACGRAVQVLPPLMKLNPQVARGWYALAVCHDREGDVPEAVDAASRYRALAPTDPKGLMVMARVLEHSGKWSQALVMYKRLLALGAEEFTTEARRGVERLALKVKSNADFASEMYSRALEASSQGRGADAVLFAIRGLSAAPEHRGLLLILARQAPVARKCLKSLKFLKTGARLYPHEQEIVFSHAYCARVTGRLGQALGAYRDYVTTFPKDPDGWFGLGETYRLMGRYGAAIEAFRTYLRREHRRGQTRWKREARAKIRELGRLARQSVSRRKEVATISRLVDRGDTARAETLARTYVKAWPWDPAGRVVLAEALMSQARFDEARRELETAMAIDPAFPDVHRALGDLYVKLRLRDRAVLSYMRYLALAPRRDRHRKRVRRVLRALQSR